MDQYLGFIERYIQFARLISLRHFLTAVVSFTAIWLLLGRPVSYWVVPLLSLLTNSCTLAAVFHALLVRHLLRLVRVQAVTGDFVSLAKAYRQMCRRERFTAFLARHSLEKAIFLSHGFLWTLLWMSHPGASANFPGAGSSEVGLRSERLFAQYADLIARFGVGMTKKADRTSEDIRIEALQEVVALLSADLGSAGLGETILSTYNDGPGIMSTLNHLYRVAFVAVLRPSYRTAVLVSFRAIDLDIAVLGWLSARFFQSAIEVGLSRKTSVQVDWLADLAKTTAARLVADSVDRQRHPNTALDGRDEIMWECRNSLISQLTASLQ